MSNINTRYTEGDPCPICKGVEYFTIGLGCVDCTNREARVKKSIRKGKTFAGDVEYIKDNFIGNKWQI